MESHLDCANKAAENEKAKFWTYHASAKKCWIKTSNAGKKTQEGLVSGNVDCACNVEEKTDYLGNDIKKGKFKNVESQEDCAKKAAENKDAKFWTYQPSKKICWIKTSKAGKKPQESTVSGNVECGQ